MTEKIEGVIATVGKKYRILMPYKEQIYVILRFQVGRDSSFYLFDTPAHEIRYGKATIKGGTTSVTVDITQGELIEDPSTLETDHNSFHGSGLVKTPTGRFEGPPLRNLLKASQLAMMIFPHISGLKKIKNIRKTDLIVEYPIDEKGPLCLNIIATPRSKATNVAVKIATFQWSYAFVYENLLTNDDLVIIFTFYHSPGEWPEAKVTVTIPDFKPIS
jgi:hypothetical protein